MIESIPNPLADKGVKRDIDEKVSEILNRRVGIYDGGIAGYIRKLVKDAAEWGMAEGFRMWWRVCESRMKKGGGL